MTDHDASISSDVSGSIVADRDLIRSIRGPESGARDDAMRSLYGRLRAVAQREVGGKAYRPGFDPSSIVISVLAKRLDRVLSLSNDDDHLRASLSRAVKNKVIDRARRDRARSLEAAEPTRARDGAPDAALIGREDEQRAFNQFTNFVARLTSLAANDRERQLIELFAVMGYGWETVAGEIGMSAGAARTAFTRLRGRILNEVFAPLSESLGSEAWSVVNSMLIERSKPEDAALLIGRDVGAVHKIYEDEIVPALRDEFGPASLVVIQRLIGK